MAEAAAAEAAGATDACCSDQALRRAVPSLGVCWSSCPHLQLHAWRRVPEKKVSLSLRGGTISAMPQCERRKGLHCSWRNPRCPDCGPASPDESDRGRCLAPLAMYCHLGGPHRTHRVRLQPLGERLDQALSNPLREASPCPPRRREETDGGMGRPSRFQTFGMDSSSAHHQSRRGNCRCPPSSPHSTRASHALAGHTASVRERNCVIISQKRFTCV